MGALSGPGRLGASARLTGMPTIDEVNDALSGNPGLINSDPTATGWIYKIAIADIGEIDGLLDAAAYADLTK